MANEPCPPLTREETSQGRPRIACQRRRCRNFHTNATSFCETRCISLFAHDDWMDRKCPDRPRAAVYDLARKALQEEGLTQEKRRWKWELVARPVGDSRTRRHAEVAEELSRLALTMGTWEGSFVRDEVRDGVARLLTILQHDPPDEKDRRHYHYLIAQCAELVRDAGVDIRARDPRREITQLMDLASMVTEQYRRLADAPRMARALLLEGNSYRVAETLVADPDLQRGLRSQALARSRNALRILRECHANKPNDEAVLLLLNEAQMWLMRLTQEREHLESLLRLRDQSSALTIVLQTERELSGFHGMARRFRESEDHITRLRKVSGDLGLSRCHHPAPTLLTPEIHLLLDTGQLDEAKKLIDEYLRLYEENRDVFYYQKLTSWNTKYGLGLRISPPVYASPILIYLYPGPWGEVNF